MAEKEEVSSKQEKQNGCPQNATASKFSKGKKQQTLSVTRGRSESRDTIDSTRKDSPSPVDSWECDLCKETFSDSNDKLLTCEYCAKHRCIACLGMNKTVYKAISGRPDLPWFCGDCVVKSLESIKQTKSIEDRCSDFISEFQKKVDERMCKIEEDVSTIKVSMETMKDEIVKEVVSATSNKHASAEDPISKTDADTIVKQATNEMQSRLERKNNIVMFNVKEPTGNLKDDIIKQDVAQVLEIGKEIGADLTEDDVLLVKRVGRRGQIRKVHGKDVEVPRLLISTFTETVKSIVMKKAYKLQYSDSEYLRTIGLKHDMSQDERKEDSRLRREAKQMQEDSDNENFVFLVRGPSWERKIIKVKKTGGGAEAPLAES